MVKKQILTISSITLTGLWCVSLATAQVQHGELNVVENDPNNNPESVTVTRVGGAGAWTVDPNTSNRADYTVDFGQDNDQLDGVLLVGPAEDDRIEPSVNNGETPYFATVSTAPSGSSDNYFIPVHRSPNGNEVNYNVAFAYFPIIDGWPMLTLYNSQEDGPITSTVGNQSIQVFTNFEENDPNVIKTPSRVIDSLSSNFVVILDGIDMRRDGVLLACAATNENHYTPANTQPNGIGILNTRENSDNGGGQKQAPTTFVFIPEGTPGVTMGSVSGSGRKIFEQGDFTVALEGAPTVNGTFRLTIPNADPNNGTLIVTPISRIDGGATVDNPAFVTYDSNGSWIITSRDIGGMGLQDISSGEKAFHFAYFDASTPITPVGPTRPYADRLDDVVSARFVVQEFTADNSNGDMRADREIGADSLGIYQDNRGDVGIKWLNARPRARQANGQDAVDGVWLGNPTEFFRDNTAVSGFSGWGVFAFDNGEARTFVSDSIGGEFNLNFATTIFPAGAGFDQDADVQVTSGTADTVTVNACLADALADGVLMAVNWDNNNRFVTVEPNGVEYIVRPYDATTGELANDWDYGYVHLPYETPNLVAGWIDPNGAVISGTGNFSTATNIVSIDDPFIGQIDVPVTDIVIPDVDPATDGIIVVTSMGGSFNSANFTPSWQVGSSAFQVAGWDPAALLPSRIAFGFVYVPFDDQSLAAPLDGDLNDDGFVDAADGLTAAGCVNGEGVSTVPAGCDPVDFREADLECDLDVDMDNFAVIQSLVG